MRRLSFALALLLVAPIASAQVYKWVDAKGTTHFSESPPPAGTKYSQVNIAASDSEAAAASSTALPVNAPNVPTDSGSQPQLMTDTPQNRAKLCTQLKGSIDALTGSAPVVEQQNGQQTLLNPDQRKQQLDASQSQYQLYCAQ
ncbi:DUF4124 domain-containing protein [Dyella dinghuensis]|uniref:DUF4124 domain-containing protein n=1 Tax=Dyella dinghuensis TaxID=1920169 RepID=A0A3S0PYG1_9GAMM|nr:DUF4124 domain-containing protein [Dyella dinghuensis]RUL63984.1 DUF4124 domain-containing protein [Dyella dinghuensis]